MAGKVYLVGAGPGNPGLITVRGRELVSRAEVLVYDAPCDEELLALAPQTAERIAVGRWPDSAKMRQAEISRLLVVRAQRGQAVVRLKSGDPYMFGRGGEEAEALARAGLSFEVVPGVAGALAAAAFSGIPFTQKEIASSVVFLIAQSGATPAEWGLDLDALAKTSATAVIHLDPAIVAPLAGELVQRGRAADTPIAVVESGGCARERTFAGSLCDIGGRAREARPPAVVFIGEAVRLRGLLGWAERRPLAGKTVVLTRTRAQSQEMAALLDEEGAQVLVWPCVAIEPPESFAALDEAARDLARFEWIVFSSANGVEGFLARLAASGKDLRALGKSRIAAVGPTTAKALAQARLVADAVPEEFNAEALAALFDPRGVAGRRILVVRAQEGRETLPEELRRMGAEVTLAPAYRTVRPDVDVGPWRACLGEGQVSAIAFASPSAVRHFASFFAPGEAARLLSRVCIAAIGKVTARAAVEALSRVDLTPEDSTGTALVEEIVRRLRPKA